jgi:hypothetical protein
VPAADVEAEIEARRIDKVRAEGSESTEAQQIARRILSEVA